MKGIFGFGNMTTKLKWEMTAFHRFIPSLFKYILCSHGAHSYWNLVNWFPQRWSTLHRKMMVVVVVISRGPRPQGAPKQFDPALLPDEAFTIDAFLSHFSIIYFQLDFKRDICRGWQIFFFLKINKNISSSLQVIETICHRGLLNKKVQERMEAFRSWIYPRGIISVIQSSFSHSTGQDFIFVKSSGRNGTWELTNEE